MAITALPPAPSRADPANFANEADAWVAALDLFTTEANALQSDVNAKQVTASSAATTATTQATNASNSASSAATSATNASNSASSAATSATNAAASYDSFDDRYLGAKASAPTLDNDGNAILDGALYWNTSSPAMHVRTGGVWQVVGGTNTPQNISVNSSTTALTVTQSGAGHAFVVEDTTSDTTPFIIDASGSVTVGGAATIATNTTSDALRITQSGTGNAFVVEDASGDATPFVIDTDGKVVSGYTVAQAFNYASAPRFQINGTTQSTSAITSFVASATATASAALLMGRSRGTQSAPTAVSSDDDIGLLQFEAHDGTALIPAASILAEVDGTPGTGSMPGRLVFSTTPSGSSTPVERMRIDTSGNIQYQPTGADVSNVASINGGQLAGMRNKIINGKMGIAQRGTNTSINSASGSVYILDRFAGNITGSTGALALSQSADAPSSNPEFQNSFNATVTTADAAVAAGDYSILFQRIEGFNVRDLVGKTFTLSFWVRSSKTGIHCVSFGNTNDRSYVTEYTINAANTWEKKSITVSGGLITAGTWNWTNGAGLSVYWPLMTGSSLQTTAGAWQTGVLFGTANQVNCLDTIGNIFAITGVQLEVGSVATPFEHRPYGVEMALCQRYYCVFHAAAGAAYPSATGAQARSAFYFPVQMRTVPSLVAGTISAGSNISSDSLTPDGSLTALGGTYRVTQGEAFGNFYAYRYYNTASAEI